MKKIIILVLILVAVIVISIKKIHKQDSQAKNFSEKPLPVYSKTIKKQDIKKTLDYLGTLHSESRVKIASRITQKIVAVYKDEKDTVKKGDILVKLDDSSIKEQLKSLNAQSDSLKLAIDSKKSMLSSLKENFSYWEKELERNKTLLNKNAIPQETMDKTLTEYQKAKSSFESQNIEISKMKSDLIALQSKINSQKIILEYTVIKSDVDGIVAEKDCEPGDIAAMGKPLIVLDSTRQYKILFNFSQEDSNKIKEGKKVIITCPEKNDVIYSTIHKVYSSVSKDRTLTAEVLINPKKDSNILIGRYISLKVVIAEKANVLTIPNRLIMNKNNKSFIYTIKDEHLKLTEIQTGITDGYNTEIIKGLSENDIIASGNFMDLSGVYDNQKIIIIKGAEK